MLPVNFSTNEAAFLQRNFSPAIFSWLPWEILTEKSGITKDLAADIRYWRTKGASFQQIASYRNEAVANRCVGLGPLGGHWTFGLQVLQNYAASVPSAMM